MTTYYIGLATTPHDPALAIVNSTGEVVFAEAAERYLQNKRGWCSPPDDFLRIEQILRTYCKDASELIISTSWQKDFLIKLQQSVHGSSGKLLKERIGSKHFYHFKACTSYLNLSHGANTENHFRIIFPNANVRYSEFNHHLTHAAAACYSSNFSEAMCLVVDGFGENTNVSAYKFSNGNLQLLSDKNSTASLGEFYGMICELCGFDPSRGEEWKVMGLAPYGKMNMLYYEILKQYFIVDDIVLHAGKHMCDATILRELSQVGYQSGCDPMLYADLAFVGQYIFTETLCALLSNLAAKGPETNIVLAGGCALNSASIGKITRETKFKNSYIFCAPADDGNAVGAAYLAYIQDKKIKPSPRIQALSPYLGSYLDKNKIELTKRYSGFSSMSFDDDDQLVDFVSENIADGYIIGWAQGRAEFGPRALGNRSILADPRRSEIKTIINERVKYREMFRPFAPSILHELGEDYFEDYHDTPYMERALYFREDVRDKVPGVVHVDGTGRLQSVHREMNERYYLLIKSFYQKTGIPILLNTSFNVMGKPIIHSVEDALAVFLTSGIDLLVLENTIFAKKLLRKKVL